MLHKRNNKYRQDKMILATINDLMPKEHFLRDLDQLVDFDFVYDEVANSYSNTGRLSIDPVVIVKMLLLGYLYGIDSERKIERECIVNIAYRWFLGLDFDDKIPDHSTISQLRRRNFKDTQIFQIIFDKIVYQCIEVGLVSGELLLTDSTHIKANATMTAREVICVEQKPSKYIQSLDEMAIAEGLIKEKILENPPTKEVVKSTTDPDAGLMNRPGKPKGFHYLSHQTCDAKSGIITDVFVTAGNVGDNVPHCDRIVHQLEKFHFDTRAICGDSGYYSSEIHREMYLRHIQTYIPPHRGELKKEGMFSLSDFPYDEEKDVFICPNNQHLTRRSFVRGGGGVRFATSPKQCRGCPFCAQCIQKQKIKVIERPFYFRYSDKQNVNLFTDPYFQAMRLRKIWAEGNFSHQKANHNLNSLRKRGKANVLEHCLCSAIALNLKRLVRHLKVAGSAAIEVPFCCGEVCFVGLMLAS